MLYREKKIFFIQSSLENTDKDTSDTNLSSGRIVIMSNNLLLLCTRVILVVGALGTTSAIITKNMNRQGVVTGILYIGDYGQGMAGSSIVVDTEILWEGDSIHGAEVVGIEKFWVEFEKNGVYWKQKVQQLRGLLIQTALEVHLLRPSQKPAALPFLISMRSKLYLPAHLQCQILNLSP